jgi:hypothetical protein
VSLRRAIRELRRRANGDFVMARQRPIGIEAARRAEEAARLRARACAEHEQAPRRTCG